MLKIALITGGSKGIGLAVVKRLVSTGVQVITCGRSKTTWSDALREQPSLQSVDFREADISSRTDIDELFSYVAKHYETLDIAVNNASPRISSEGAFKKCAPEALLETLNADFFGQALCIQHELKLMKSGGCIVNVSSVNGLRPAPNAAMYGASKHAIESLTRSLALEAISDGVRINAVAPGVTWTPRWEERSRGNPRLRGEVEGVVPARRFATPDEVAGAIEWLCSAAASYVVGHTLVIDGGLSLS